jgi:hypothetical protein
MKFVAQLMYLINDIIALVFNWQVGTMETSLFTGREASKSFASFELAEDACPMPFNLSYEASISQAKNK